MGYDTDENILDKVNDSKERFLSNYGEYNKSTATKLRVVTKNYTDEDSLKPRYEIILDTEIAVIAIKEVNGNREIIDLNLKEVTKEFVKNKFMSIIDWDLLTSVEKAETSRATIEVGSKVAAVTSANNMIVGEVIRITVNTSTFEKEFVVKSRGKSDIRIKSDKIILLNKLR
mgnify:CR=1 FL=1